ncbi:MAG: glycosyltransferase family 4 protein [Maritimibacter sp.]|uniref:glycosyltransferase family 4 protein n=1 Tax=Maritimibacter sp. TaxID=2003363 RepID=UPI001E1A4094|nr:glycosyltransferase family 4 protein [Maritimibacter sp.]MBL6427649.1 glycosyltransferase family 4 protein [Maritimibacter sp.]
MESVLRTAGEMVGVGSGQSRVTEGLLRDLEAAPLGEGDVVYTVIVNEDLEVMQRLKDRGVKIVHECILGPDVGLLLLEEHSRFPDLGPAPDKSEIEQGRARDARKYAVADLTLVPSVFTETAVRELAPKEVCVARVPYGFSLDSFSGRPDVEAEQGRALAVGSVGRRKGHPDLAAAARLLAARGSHVHVRVVGPVEDTVLRHPAMCGPTYVGQVPRSLVANEYAKADFFVLPTICDSFGIVIVEAMAAGLPVITTPNCGDIVRDGIDGFIVPIRDPETLAARMEELSEDRGMRAQMSAAARERAMEFSQEAYAKRLLHAVRALDATFQNKVIG